MAIASGFTGQTTRAIASAQTPTINLSQRLDCTNPISQSQMNACEGQRWRDADRELNQVYQSLTPNLSGSRRQQLVDAQLAWIEFRDTECEFSSSFAEGGTMQPMLRSGCLANLTEQRIFDLYEYREGTIPSAVSSNYQSADDRLNAVYQKLLGQLPDFRKTQLKDAELAWIDYRDALCEFERSGGGNAGFETCMIRTTEQRINQLENHLEDASL